MTRRFCLLLVFVDVFFFLYGVLLLSFRFGWQRSSKKAHTRRPKCVRFTSSFAFPNWTVPLLLRTGPLSQSLRTERDASGLWAQWNPSLLSTRLNPNLLFLFTFISDKVRPFPFRLGRTHSCNICRPFPLCLRGETYPRTKFSTNGQNKYSSLANGKSFFFFNFNQ